MKKLFLLTITAGLALSSFAQVLRPTPNKAPAPTFNGFSKSGSEVANKTSLVTIHDTLFLDNRGATDTVANIYTVVATTDSGYVFGTSSYGFDGFAERYDFNGTDSSVKVLGIVAGLVGAASTPSTHNAVFKVWSMSSPQTISATYTYSGVPNNVLDSVIVPYSSLTFNDEDVYWFATPTSYLTASFFVGLTTDYNWAALGGDTLGIVMSDGRTSILDTIIGGVDTVVNNQSMSRISGTWLDNGIDIFTTPLRGEYFLFPLVDTKDSTHLGVKLTNKNFSFNGNYPNPAISNMNIKFTLANSTNVTIQIMDVTGRTINTINENSMSAGEHVVNVETANMPAGDYVYIIRTTQGTGIASKFAVIK